MNIKEMKELEKNYHNNSKKISKILTVMKQKLLTKNTK